MGLGFIQREEFRIGLEAGLFNNAIVLDMNYFRQDTKGLLTTGQNTVYPSYFNAGRFNLLSYTNFENDRRTGLDFSLKLNKKIGELYTGRRRRRHRAARLPAFSQRLQAAGRNSSGTAC